MQQQFDKASSYFLNGQYDKAETILLDVKMHATIENNQALYVKSMIWLNRIYINTMRYDELHQQLLLLNPLVQQHANEEDLYRFKSQLMMFNAYYFIGDTRLEFQQLFQELQHTDYTMHYFSAGLNLIYVYIEHEQLEEAFAIFEQLTPISTMPNCPYPTALYMYYMHGFILYYEKRNYDMCAQLLAYVERDTQRLLVESFSLTYYVSRAMLDMQHGHIDKAKQQFFAYLQQEPNYFKQLPLHLKLWIRTLEELQLKDDIIACQHVMIHILQQQYTSEIKLLRKETIEYYSKQFYEAQMYTDQMTNAKNRNFFESFIEKVAQVRTYCIAVLDIDRFKSINDTYGHAIGDEAIQCIAQQLLDWQPRHDIHVIRYGGDEFVLLIPYSFQDIEPYIQRLHHQFMTTPCITRDKQTIPLSVSIGLCYNIAQAVDLNVLFKQADAALYEAKKTRGTFICKEAQQLHI